LLFFLFKYIPCSSEVVSSRGLLLLGRCVHVELRDRDFFLLEGALRGLTEVPSISNVSF